MAGSGRKVFAPGEVLTATNVQNYLMDQAVQVYAGTAARGSAIGSATTEGMVVYLSDINSVQMATGTATWVNVDSLPIVAGTATRDALYPSPVLGNSVFRSDIGVIETYYGLYNATTNPGGRDSAGWYSTTRVDGLVPVRPTSVTVAGAGSSASFTSLGQLTFATATKITLNGVFTSEFRNYKIIFSASSNANNQVFYRYTVAGVETTSGYGYTVTACAPNDAAPIKQLGGTAQGYGVIGYCNTAQSSYSIDVFDPQVSEVTKFLSKSFYPTVTMNDAVGATTVTTQFDGLSLFTSAGTFGGVLSVYGYNKQVM